MGQEERRYVMRFVPIPFNTTLIGTPRVVPIREILMRVLGSSMHMERWSASGISHPQCNYTRNQNQLLDIHLLYHEQSKIEFRIFFMKTPHASSTKKLEGVCDKKKL